MAKFGKKKEEPRGEVLQKYFKKSKSENAKQL